jgi:hypothetical protein
VLYYERKGNWLFAKGNFYAWLYDESGAGGKVESGEYDFIMFPPMGKGSPFSDRYVPPLLMVWQKTYQKSYKGSEHLLGIVKGFYDEDKNQLIIEMMTTNPKFRRKGVNAHIIKQLRDEFGVSQEDVIFDKPTKEGKLFESSKKYHLGGDMSKHLAPNGKPSNLTHEQWHMVRTPEFKAWFGDWENDPKNASKVVDDNGEPLVVYHGTMVETTFNVFDYDKADLGFHFGTSEQAKNRVESKSILPSRKSIVNSFFLNIRVLFEMSDAGEWQYPQRYIDELTSDNIIEEKIAKQKGFFSLYEREDNALIRDYIKSKYGSAVGFVYNNKYEGKGKSFIALSTNQIKLADGTNTKFDGNNSDIRFNKGGLIAPNGNQSNLTPEQYKLVRTEAFKNWFGDWENDPKNASKVVDENGEPLVVYRGSKSKNPNYIPHKHELSNGIYFSTKKEVAELYTTSVWQNWVGRVFECFLNIRNLDEYDTLQLKSNIYQADFDYYNKIVTTSYENKFDGIRWDNFIDVPDLQNIFPKEPIDFIATTFIVFEPNQIKLADGTNTTFDGNNPDIRFANGGLIAPNGKESNLTPEQYKLVRTEAFKNWFGDWENDPNNSSKVVDENGEPLVVYHGSNKNFDTFNFKIGNGIYNSYSSFTQNKNLSESYGIISYAVFLKIQKPYIVNGGGQYIWKVIDKKNSPDSFFDEYVPKSYDGIMFRDVIDFNGVLGSKYILDVSDIYMVRNNTQIKLSDGTNTTFDGNNPDIRFANGGEIDETAQMYIDIISMNPNLEKYQKYKDILKREYDIDFDSIYKDNEYIENANLQDIKSQSDFLDFDNWLKYAKKISMMRGFVRMDDYMMAFKYDVTDDVWKRMSDKLDFRIEKVPYIETTTSGDIARVMGNTLYYTEHADLYYLLHEIGHIYDFQNNVSGIIHNPAYSPTHYGTMNGGETFAENFAIYFINPMALKNWNKDVYDEMENTINPKYKYELSSLVSEYIDEKLAKGGRTIAQTPAPKSDRVYGSKTNPKGSASDSELAKSIKFNDNLEKAIENKVIKYNDEHPMDKVRIQTAKAVVRRGMGAYSKSHRPTISGGAPNSRQAWGLARLNKFLLKKSGVKVKSAYIQDDDLLEK